MPALWRHGATNTPQSFFLRIQENSQYETRETKRYFFTVTKCEEEEKKANKNEKTVFF